MSNEVVTLNDARELLRTYRDDNIRNSDTVVELWDKFVASSVDRMGEEKFLILEQVAMAAAEVGRSDVLDDCLWGLKTQFPDSLRVKRLHILKLEMNGAYDYALKALDETSKLDETNPAARKRKVAIYKSMGNTSEAIKELVEHLKTFMCDREAWQELGELYLADNDLARACFCLEEVIVQGPLNHLHHQRLADIRYTMGGAENLNMARAHYSLALKLFPGNVRALYGLLLCSINTPSPGAKVQSKKKESNKMVSWTVKQLEDRYKDTNMESSLSDLLSSMQISTA